MLWQPQSWTQLPRGRCNPACCPPSHICRYCLLERCLEFAEPALLCGETGTGKTTVCQMAAFVR